MYLSGGAIPATLGRGDIGMMLTPAQGNRAPLRAGLPWAADNGVFSGKWREDVWLGWLRKMLPYQKTCLFAVAPDVVGDAAATLARSLPYLPVIRALGYKAAFVSQDGATVDGIPWDDLDCLFVGGSTEWKFSPASMAICREAKRRGKWVHCGRVNSLERMRHCALALMDSADGTCVAFAPDVYLPRICSWLDAINSQPSIWSGDAA